MSEHNYPCKIQHIKNKSDNVATTTRGIRAILMPQTENLFYFIMQSPDIFPDEISAVKQNVKGTHVQ
jgi:hypothetical protein